MPAEEGGYRSGMCVFSLYFPVYQGNRQRRVRSRLHPPPASLVSVPRLCGAGTIQQEFSEIAPVPGPIQAPNPNSISAISRKFPNRLCWRFCEFGFGENIWQFWPELRFARLKGSGNLRRVDDLYDKKLSQIGPSDFQEDCVSLDF